MRDPVSLFLKDAVQRLEPCAGKLARTVPRGGCAGNSASLPYGKSRKPYEFGCKVSVVTTAKEQFVLSCLAEHGNPYDGHTLERSLRNAALNSGQVPHHALVDRGYRGAEHSQIAQVHITGKKKGVGKAHPQQNRRNGVEAIIGHMKTDGQLDRNYLTGRMGDRIHAVLCGAGQNMRMILRKLRALLFWLLLQVRGECGKAIHLINGLVEWLQTVLHSPLRATP